MRVGSVGRVFLGLESLEHRDQPSANPSILNYSATEVGNGLFQVTGQVSDTNPGNLSVTFGGTTSDTGATATTNADGTFSETVQLSTNGNNAGYLTATATDNQGLSSSPVEVYLNPTSQTPVLTPPTIANLSDAYLGNGQFMITGQVLDPSPGGLTVSFSGGTWANGLTTTTNADGTFSETVQLSTNGNNAGYLTATTTDNQGLTALPVQEYLSPPNQPPVGALSPGALSPVIVGFSAKQIGNGLFVITGKVDCTNPGGLTITFGGATSASGRTVTTNADGTFTMQVQLRTDGTDCGCLTASTVVNGLQSQVVDVFLEPTTP
jgi:hypothetical protein